MASFAPARSGEAMDTNSGLVVSAIVSRYSNPATDSENPAKGGRLPDEIILRIVDHAVALDRPITYRTHDSLFILRAVKIAKQFGWPKEVVDAFYKRNVFHFEAVYKTENRFAPTGWAPGPRVANRICNLELLLKVSLTPVWRGFSRDTIFCDGQDPHCRGDLRFLFSDHKPYNWHIRPATNSSMQEQPLVTKWQHNFTCVPNLTLILDIEHETTASALCLATSLGPGRDSASNTISFSPLPPKNFTETPLDELRDSLKDLYVVLKAKQVFINMRLQGGEKYKCDCGCYEEAVDLIAAKIKQE